MTFSDHGYQAVFEVPKDAETLNKAIILALQYQKGAEVKAKQLASLKRMLADGLTTQTLACFGDECSGVQIFDLYREVWL